MMDENKEVKLTLSEQAQLCVVELFQKALVSMKDVSNILCNLEFKIDISNNELVVSNPETCKLTEDDLLDAELQTVGQKEYKNKA